VLALRVSDLDFDQKLIRVRQSLDCATRKVQACKSHISSADVPMPPQLEIRLLRHLARGRSESELRFFNRNARPYSANKLREKQLHPILLKLGIARGGFHAARHGATSEMWQTALRPQLYRSKCAIPMPESPLGFTVTLWGMRNGKPWRNTQSVSKNT